jgi:ribonuclease HII
MRRAVTQLGLQPDYLLVDGNRCFPDSPWPYDTIVKGDSRSHSIAAASIVAKTTRDRLMEDLHDVYPAYGWARNAGYPTAAHYEALAQHGPTPFHRQTFRLMR